MEKIYREPEARAEIKEKIEASLITRPSLAETISISGFFEVEHIRNGKVIDRDWAPNVVTDVGKAALLDKVLGLQSAFGAIHMGLKGAGAVAGTDTMAQVAAGGNWDEIAAAVVSTRLVPTFNAASGATTVNKATTAAVSFPILTAVGVVIAGCFIALGSTATPVTGTTGTLYSAGDFTGGSKTVNSGDTLNVSYTAQLTG